MTMRSLSKVVLRPLSLIRTYLAADLQTALAQLFVARLKSVRELQDQYG